MDLNKWKMDKLDKILRDLRIYIDEERGMVSDNLHHKYGKEIKLLKLQHDKEMQANQPESQVDVKTADTTRLLIDRMKSLSDDQRKDIINNITSNYCYHCGSEYLPCYCMRDD